jgi:hypothetical protein
MQWVAIELYHAPVYHPRRDSTPTCAQPTDADHCVLAQGDPGLVSGGQRAENRGAVTQSCEPGCSRARSYQLKEFSPAKLGHLPCSPSHLFLHKQKVTADNFWRRRCSDPAIGISSIDESKAKRPIA